MPTLPSRSDCTSRRSVQLRTGSPRKRRVALLRSSRSCSIDRTAVTLVRLIVDSGDASDDVAHQLLEDLRRVEHAAHVVDVPLHLLALPRRAVELRRGDLAIRLELLQLALLRQRHDQAVAALQLRDARAQYVDLRDQ